MLLTTLCIFLLSTAITVAASPDVSGNYDLSQCNGTYVFRLKLYQKDDVLKGVLIRKNGDESTAKINGFVKDDGTINFYRDHSPQHFTGIFSNNEMNGSFTQNDSGPSFDWKAKKLTALELEKEKLKVKIPGKKEETAISYTLNSGWTSFRPKYLMSEDSICEKGWSTGKFFYQFMVTQPGKIHFEGDEAAAMFEFERLFFLPKTNYKFFFFNLRQVIDGESTVIGKGLVGDKQSFEVLPGEYYLEFRSDLSEFAVHCGLQQTNLTIYSLNRSLLKFKLDFTPKPL